MKYSSFATILLVCSAALNVGLLSGCAVFHDAIYGNPCKFSSAPTPVKVNDGKQELERIAELLDIKTSGRTTFDIASDIRCKLDGSPDVPLAYDTAAFEKMAKDLGTAEEKAMREYQCFITKLQGKRVIVIEPEN